jgi:hypothetical protein
VLVRVLLHLLALAAGTGAGLLGAFVQQRTDHGIPTGLLIGLGLTAAVYLALGLLTRSRSGPLVGFLGWIAATIVISYVRPGSDTIIPANGRGTGWLYAGLLLAFVAIVLPYGPDGPAVLGRPPSDGPPTGR